MSSFQQLLHDYLFLIPLVVLVLSELLKLVMEGMHTGNWPERLFHPGGMPSTHSAFVTSLLIVVWRKLGPTSPEFAIAFVLACVMWYDAFGVRHRIDKQAEILTRLQHKRRFPEHLGHSFREVIAGIIFGTAITGFGIWLS